MKIVSSVLVQRALNFLRACPHFGELCCRYDVPLVADIHFQPQVAMIVAEAFEKIRINPGNFADGRKSFKVINYDDPKQFELEREHMQEVGNPSCPELDKSQRYDCRKACMNPAHRIWKYWGILCLQL